MLGVLDLHFHQRHPERILFQGPGFFYWVTEDFGRTYQAFPTPGEASLGFWMELKIHPNVPDWLLAKVKRKDCLADLSSAACAHDLFISKVWTACNHLQPDDRWCCVELQLHTDAWQQMASKEWCSKHGSVQATNVVVVVPGADPHATHQQQQWLFNE